MSERHTTWAEAKALRWGKRSDPDHDKRVAAIRADLEASLERYKTWEAEAEVGDYFASGDLLYKKINPGLVVQLPEGDRGEEVY